MDPNELKEITESLKTSITQGIVNAFKVKDMKAFDAKGNPISTPNETDNQKTWDDFIKAANARKADEAKMLHEQDIQRKIDEIKQSNQADSKLARDQLKDLQNELNRSQNGGISEKDAKDYKWKKRTETFNRIKVVVDGLMQTAQGIQGIVLSYYRTRLQLSRNYFAYQQTVAKANLALMTKQTQSVITTFNSLTSGDATEAGFSIYKSSGDESLAGTERAMNKSGAAQELQAAEIKRDAERIKSVTSNIGMAAMGVGGAVAAIAGWTGVGAIIGGAIAGLGALTSAIGGMVAASKEVDYEKIKQSKEQFQEQMQLAIDSMGNLKEVVGGFDSTVQTLTKHIIANDTEYKKVGLTFGFTGDAYSSYARRMSAELTKNFNITAQEAASMMTNYASESSRAKMINTGDLEKVYGTGKAFGISSQEAASLYGSMNVFNVSISSGEKSLTKMYKTITRMGLNATKFSRELKENLKLAEKYNFKGGVTNMMKLTQWAQQTRFNLTSAASFADSIMSGTLSEALEKSAKLQVLGGNAAIYSDPLGMLYDAGADVGSMAERIHKMFGDITGTFNRTTGETDFSWFENKMIMERAKALGMDPGDVKNMIRQSAKQGDIDKLIGNKLNAQDRTAIGNNATWNADKGKWEVDTLNGTMDVTDFAKLDEETRNKILLPKNEEDSIVQIARSAMSIDELLKQRFTHLQNEKEPEMYTSAADYADKTMKAQEEIFHMSTFVAEAKSSLEAIGNNAITQSQETINFFAENTETIKTYRKSVEEGIKQSKQLTELTIATAKIKAQENGDEKLAQIVAAATSAYSSTKLGQRDKAMTELYKNATPLEREYLRAAYIGYDAKGIFSSETEANAVQNDGFGYTNGGYITNATNVKPINDGRVTVRTARRDQYLAAMPNGPIDKILQQLIPGLQALLSSQDVNSGIPSNGINIEINGKLTLSQDGTTINLVDVMRKNPAMAMKFVKVLARASEVNDNGRPIHNYMV